MNLFEAINAKHPQAVIPAKAGIYVHYYCGLSALSNAVVIEHMDPGQRPDDGRGRLLA